MPNSCLRYCKSTSFQANHNWKVYWCWSRPVVCDTAKVRVFKQITTKTPTAITLVGLFAILQKYEFSSKSQRDFYSYGILDVVCDTAKVRVFKQITTTILVNGVFNCCLRYCKSTSFQANHNSTAAISSFIPLFAILQKYEFSSKSQQVHFSQSDTTSCLRYCKSTSFQANHNASRVVPRRLRVVCDTAKVRVFKQITTIGTFCLFGLKLFAILQKYEFSSKSQHTRNYTDGGEGCLRYCKSTSFQANHNRVEQLLNEHTVVCDTAKVRVFKQITTHQRQRQSS